MNIPCVIVVDFVQTENFLRPKICLPPHPRVDWGNNEMEALEDYKCEASICYIKMTAEMC